MGINNVGQIYYPPLFVPEKNRARKKKRMLLWKTVTTLEMLKMASASIFLLTAKAKQSIIEIDSENIILKHDLQVDCIFELIEISKIISQIHNCLIVFWRLRERIEETSYYLALTRVRIYIVNKTRQSIDRE